MFADFASDDKAFGEKAVWGQFSGLPTLAFPDGKAAHVPEHIAPPPGLGLQDMLCVDSSHAHNGLHTEDITDSAKTRGLLGADFCSFFEDADANVEQDITRVFLGEPVIGVPQTKLAQPSFVEKVSFSSQSNDAGSTTDPSHTSASSDVEQDSSSISTGYLGLDQSTHDTITAASSQLFASSDFDADADFLVAQNPRRQVTLPEPEPVPSTPNSEMRKDLVSADGWPLDPSDDSNASLRTKLRSEAKEFKPGAFEGHWQDDDQEREWAWPKEQADDGNGGFPSPPGFEAEMLAAASFGVKVASAVAHLSQWQGQGAEKSTFCFPDENLGDFQNVLPAKLNAAVSRREQAAIASVVQQNVQALKMRTHVSQSGGTTPGPSCSNVLRSPSVGGNGGKQRAAGKVARKFCHLCGKSVQPFFKFCASCGGTLDI